MSFENIPNNVTIFYGPYHSSNGIYKHNVQKVYGLFQALDKLQFDIELIPTNYLNQVGIHFCDAEVFCCDIRNLKFNMPMKDDPICKTAINSIKEIRDTLRKVKLKNIPLACLDEAEITKNKSSDLENIRAEEDRIYSVFDHPESISATHSYVDLKFLDMFKTFAGISDDDFLSRIEEKIQTISFLGD